MRKLASIQQIDAIHTIEGKDRIVLAVVKGWSVIVQKGQFSVGELAVFIEPDSVLPERPEFDFLKSKKYRIKTMKMGGVLSQGICFPMSILPQRTLPYCIDDDVTDLLNVKKYDPYENENADPVAQTQQNQSRIKSFMLKSRILRPIGKIIFCYTKKESNGFPDFVAKTDETRIQNMPFILANKKLHYVGREKIDGQSGTFFLKVKKRMFPWMKRTYEFGVCSRNRRLLKEDQSSYWYVAKKYNIESVLRQIIGDSDWVCVQGECIAPNVQGNRYHVTSPDLYCFNLIYPNGKVDCIRAEKLMTQYGLKWVPMVVKDYVLPDTVNEILEFSTGESKLYKCLREGVVFRNYGLSTSFKAVSPDYLIEHDE